MSRLTIWAFIVFGAISCCGVRYGFAMDGLETVAIIAYFSGAALLLNWRFGEVKK
jgi:hypothetical protein